MDCWGRARSVVLQEGVENGGDAAVLAAVDVLRRELVQSMYCGSGQDCDLPIIASKYLPLSVTLVRPMTGAVWVT